MILEKTTASDKILMVHNGALGDFFMTWPAILALRTALPDNIFLWAGKTGVYRWLSGLGISPAGPDLHHGLRSLYGAAQWPPELNGVRIIWFGLKGPPPIVHERILFLPGIDDKHPDTPPRDLYLARLTTAGIPAVPDWLAVFRNRWCATDPKPGSPILLFPGSGHPAKNWSLVKYLELASGLQKAGERPCFVFGPVESESGMDCAPFPVYRPENLDELENLTASARLVVGNDSGPMHLAGYLGTPGLVLFGPTNPHQWGPPGLVALTSDVPCRPCSTTARISCSRPVCLEISSDRVLARVQNILHQEEEG
jgi:ADP-heptose:LPS heptosyltransferase